LHPGEKGRKRGDSSHPKSLSVKKEQHQPTYRPGGGGERDRITHFALRRCVGQVGKGKCSYKGGGDRLVCPSVKRTSAGERGYLVLKENTSSREPQRGGPAVYAVDKKSCRPWQPKRKKERAPSIPGRYVALKEKGPNGGMTINLWGRGGG